MVGSRLEYDMIKAKMQSNLALYFEGILYRNCRKIFKFMNNDSVQKS